MISILFRNDFKNMLFQSKFVGSRSNINLDSLYSRRSKKNNFGQSEYILIELR